MPVRVNDRDLTLRLRLAMAEEALVELVLAAGSVCSLIAHHTGGRAHQVLAGGRFPLRHSRALEPRVDVWEARPPQGSVADGAELELLRTATEELNESRRGARGRGGRLRQAAITRMSASDERIETVNSS